MSMVQQIISAAADAERQIDDQMSKLYAYMRGLDQIHGQIEAYMEGSEQQYGRQMEQQINITKSQVNETIERLQVAKDKLLRIRMI